MHFKSAPRISRLTGWRCQRESFTRMLGVFKAGVASEQVRYKVSKKALYAK